MAHQALDVMCAAIWDERRERYLRDNWSTMSAAEIASNLGYFTKSAVIGKAHRLGLPSKRMARPKRPVSLSTLACQKPSAILADAPLTLDFRQKKRAPPIQPNLPRPRDPIEIDGGVVKIFRGIGTYPVTPAIKRAAREFLAYRSVHHQGAPAWA